LRNARPGTIVALFCLLRNRVPQCRNYTNKIVVGNALAVTISNLTCGTIYYFAIKDYNADGIESGFSNEATYSPTAGSR
jgi:hypothetical protein